MKALKKLFASAAVIVIFLYSCSKNSGSSNPPPPPPPPPPPVDTCVIALTNGLIGYYPFTGDFNDYSGHGNNAIAMNGAHLGTDKKGNASFAAEFDGVDDYALVNDNGSLNMDSGTVSFWFMLNSLNSRAAFVNRIKFADATALSWSINRPFGGADNRISYTVIDNAQDCSLMPNNDGIGTLFAAPTIVAGTWYQLTATFSFGVEKIYLNGNLLSSQTLSYNSFKRCVNSQLIIGGWWNSDVISINGRIDDVRIYNRILRSCEITKLAVDIP